MTDRGRLGRDAGLLFATRSVRMFGYGLVSVVLVLYLAAVGVPAAAERSSRSAVPVGAAARRSLATRA